MAARLLLVLAAALPFSLAHQHYGGIGRRSEQAPLSEPGLSINGIPFSTRAYWMRKANEALFDVLDDPCPFAAFGTVIVNHTVDGLGELVCMGANSNSLTGNPTLHGEMAAIKNCSEIFIDPTGPYNMTAAEAQDVFSELSLYTNAESCPMCASAIQWSGFAEYIYGTSINTLIEKGWGQIRVGSMEIFRQSYDMGTTTRLIGEVLTNETDPYFFWQYDPMIVEQGHVAVIVAELDVVEDSVVVDEVELIVSDAVEDFVVVEVVEVVDSEVLEEPVVDEVVEDSDVVGDSAVVEPVEEVAREEMEESVEVDMTVSDVKLEMVDVVLCDDDVEVDTTNEEVDDYVP
ncbi:cytidine and deoxycytidylate deaminase zinc-binding region [Seiridium cupressi]